MKDTFTGFADQAEDLFPIGRVDEGHRGDERSAVRHADRELRDELAPPGGCPGKSPLSGRAPTS